MRRLRLLLLAALLAASCAGPSPSAPTDVQTSFGAPAEPSQTSGQPVSTLDIDLKETDDVDAAAAKTFTLTGVVADKA